MSLTVEQNGEEIYDVFVPGKDTMRNSYPELRDFEEMQGLDDIEIRFAYYWAKYEKASGKAILKKERRIAAQRALLCTNLSQEKREERQHHFETLKIEEEKSGRLLAAIRKFKKINEGFRIARHMMDIQMLHNTQMIINKSEPSTDLDENLKTLLVYDRANKVMKGLNESIEGYGVTKVKKEVDAYEDVDNLNKLRARQ